MKNKFFCSRVPRRQAISVRTLAGATALLVCVLGCVSGARAGDAPPWMRAVVNAPLPPHDEKTEAVLLFSETNVNVISADKIKTVERRVYKILRPEGREYGIVQAYFRSPGEKVNSMRGWCIPAQGKDYEVKDKEAVEAALPGVDGSELVNDVRVKLLRIPAADPGNVVGYEYEKEEDPLLLHDEWVFQDQAPSRESHYSLQLPPGWEYRTFFLNYPDVKPVQSGNPSEWTVQNVAGVRAEEDMPPSRGVAGRMLISFIPPGGAGAKGFADWHQMGQWYFNLTEGRRELSPDLKLRVASLTGDAATTLQKEKRLAEYVQGRVRYIEISLGIGRWQPHSASEVFEHNYGDCKDKATLMIAMLHEIGVNAYYVVINSRRGGVGKGTAANVGAFNHVITAIAFKDGSDPSLQATLGHPKLGTLMFFDPTDEVTPFGQLSGALQANYGLLVTPDGGELTELPKQAAATNSVRRTAKLSLDASGNLHGDVDEVRFGDRAASERWALRSVTTDKGRIKPIEGILAGSLANFRVVKASVTNLAQSDQPFVFKYSFDADNYAKNAGGLLLVRPRVLGVKAQGILETKEPRQYPIEFEGPVLDTDNFEIALPQGYVVDDVPPPVDADFGFASYHSKTEIKGNVLAYTRTFEIKELSVPVSQAAELKKFYRIIAADERNTAILKPSN